MPLWMGLVSNDEKQDDFKSQIETTQNNYNTECL